MFHCRPILSVYPPTCLTDGSDVLINYFNVASATDNDFVTASCGPTQGESDFLYKVS